MADPTAAALTVTAAAGSGLLVSGGALLRIARRVDPAATLLLASGVALTSAALLSRARPPDLHRPLLGLGAGLLLPLAVASYPTPRWRHPVEALALVVVVGAGVMAVIAGGRSLDPASVGLVTICALLVHTWWRYEHADPTERRALSWLALAGGSALVLAIFVSFGVDSQTGSALALLPFLLFGPAMCVGVTRPDMVDVRGLVTAAVVLAVAVIVYVSAFVCLMAVVDLFGGSYHDLSPGSLGLLGALVALTFHPLQVLLRGSVEQLLFGTRPDPLGAAGRVVGQIGDDPADALRAIREALVLPYAALRVHGVPLVSSGQPVTHTRSIPLGDDPDDPEETALVVGLRAGDLGLSRGDQEVLRLVAPLLVQTLRARALTTELLESRGQRVTAVEEERRRLRRDLHDGLGPRLSGIAFTADAARNLLRHDPGAAEDLLVTLRQETRTAIEDIRRLVYAMRPPALDELGLVPALRQQAVGLRSRDGEALTVSVIAPERLPALPAAVEVAAYRIVTEALANIARHSAARTAVVELRSEDHGLAIEVCDEAAEIDPVAAAWQAGVGLSSMRERAAELGGTLHAGPGPRGGRVTALLPLDLTA